MAWWRARWDGALREGDARAKALRQEGGSERPVPGEQRAWLEGVDEAKEVGGAAQVGPLTCGDWGLYSECNGWC